MDNLDQLSDDELRRRLLQFGFPNLPVTSTTRRILIKKLRNYMDTERSKLRRETTHATRYSSDEEGNGSDTAAASSSSSSAANSLAARRASRVGRSAQRATLAAGCQPTLIPEPASFARPKAATAQPSPMASAVLPSLRSRPSTSTPISPVAATSGLATRPSSTLGLNRSPTVYVSPLLQGSSGDEDDSSDEDAPDGDFDTPAVGGQQPQHQNGLNGNHSPYVSEFTQRLLNLRGLTVQQQQQQQQHNMRKTST